MINILDPSTAAGKSLKSLSSSYLNIERHLPKEETIASFQEAFPAETLFRIEILSGPNILLTFLRHYMPPQKLITHSLSSSSGISQ